LAWGNVRKILFALIPLACQVVASEEVAAERVAAHLLIRDSASAVREAKKGLEAFPDSLRLKTALIRALCEQGDEKEAFRAWRRLDVDSTQLEKQRALLETLAWGVLNGADRSPQLFLRVTSLLGAAFTRDARAVPVLVAHLKGSNSLLRSLAVKLAASFGDEVLRKELVRLLKEEKMWHVRLEIVQAIGQLRMSEMKDALQEIVGNPKTLLEEKSVAIVSLVEMTDAIGEAELTGLLSSNRAGLRQLGCALIAHLDLHGDVGRLLPLLADQSSDVRLAALSTLALLRTETIDGKPLVTHLEPRFRDHAPAVAIMANYLALLHGDKRGEENLKKWLRHPHDLWRRQAAAAIAASGKKGITLAASELKSGDHDLYVKVNLALGLIGQRLQIREACDILHTALQEGRETIWMWDEQTIPHFRSLAPSSVRHIEQIPHYPIVVDRFVRLELLSVLSMMRDEKAQAAIKQFLRYDAWGISGAAAATLLMEGDEEAAELVRGLLTDSDDKIRVQAALLLAMLGGDPEAVKVLQAAYPNVDRETKIYILEAIARVGDRSSLPFLLKILDEPYQVLRVVAASAMIQCLYH
jgi:HEAT repeat protein